eukprot:m.98161 g.98161  ORF g.98161 m.98161 type:complete len:156 (+) comp15262_c1_seq1:1114-1581(+)
MHCLSRDSTRTRACDALVPQGSIFVGVLASTLASKTNIGFASRLTDDDGLTWTSLAAVPELPDPGCKAGIVAWPAAKALLFSNVATTTARVNVTLRASFDDGQTWPNALLVSEAGGYSDIGRLAYQGQEYACVLLEANTCQIKLARVALKLPNQP